MTDGIGEPQSYGKYDIFNTPGDEVTWDAAEKRAHAKLRQMGVPLADPDPNVVHRVSIIRAPQAAAEIEADERRTPRAQDPHPRAPVLHSQVGERDLPPPPLTGPLPQPDPKLEAIARAHILLHFLKDTCCKEHAEHNGWIDEILKTAPQAS